MRDEGIWLQHYRRTASGLRQHAQETPFQYIREHLLRLAYRYDRLARTIDLERHRRICDAKHDAANDDVPFDIEAPPGVGRARTFVEPRYW